MTKSDAPTTYIVNMLDVHDNMNIIWKFRMRLMYRKAINNNKTIAQNSEIWNIIHDK